MKTISDFSVCVHVYLCVYLCAVYWVQCVAHPPGGSELGCKEKRSANVFSLCVQVCVRVFERCVMCVCEGGDSGQIQTPQWETQRASLDAGKPFAGIHNVVNPGFLFHVRTRAQTHIHNKLKMIHTPSRNVTCTKRAQGTSGY